MSIKKGYQFGRYVEVEVRNYLTGEKITIPNDFEIDFNFFKTVDEVDSASVGRVQIYGLTNETYKRMYSDGGVVELRCGYTQSEVKTLFIADILRMSQVSGNSTTVTTIECSANVLNYIFGGYVSAGFTDSSLMEILSSLGQQIGAKVLVGANNVPDVNVPAYMDYIYTKSFRADFAGTPSEIIAWIAHSFDFQVTDVIDKQTQQPTKVMIQRSGGVSEVFREIEAGYKKIDRTSQQYKDVKKEDDDFQSMFITPQSQMNEALVLTNDTGLRTVSMEFKIATALETQSISVNETETMASIEKRNTRERKQAEKEKKAEEKGKKLKPKQVKNYTKKVNRKSVKVVANINPSIRPQGHILIKSVNEDYNGIFIVREIEFKGNNKVGSWDMTILGEDTLGRYDQQLTEQQLLNQSNDEITGSLGDETNYGGSE